MPSDTAKPNAENSEASHSDDCKHGPQCSPLHYGGPSNFILGCLYKPCPFPSSSQRKELLWQLLWILFVNVLNCTWIHWTGEVFDRPHDFMYTSLVH